MTFDDYRPGRRHSAFLNTYRGTFTTSTGAHMKLETVILMLRGAAASAALVYWTWKLALLMTGLH